MTASALYLGHVMHHRLRPRVHRLRYRLFSLLLDLDEIDALAARLRLFSRGRFNLFGFYDGDLGDGSPTPLRDQAEALLAAAGIPAGGPIRILTMPRILGFTFNPLSVWFCHDRAGALVATLYEVHNTFGERHTYVLPASPLAGNPGAPLHQASPKRFHVSPFMGLEMTYRFRVLPPAGQLAIAITASDSQGPLLTAVHRARRQPLSDGALARAFVSHPLLTLKVVGAILWEALRLWLKRVPVYHHPGPPASASTLPPATPLSEAPCI